MYIPAMLEIPGSDLMICSAADGTGVVLRQSGHQTVRIPSFTII
jgi:hypothetical protein